MIVTRWRRLSTFKTMAGGYWLLNPTPLSHASGVMSRRYVQIWAKRTAVDRPLMGTGHFGFQSRLTSALWAAP